MANYVWEILYLSIPNLSLENQRARKHIKASEKPED